jgi:hypothetical protein
MRNDTKNKNHVDLDDLKRFSMEDSAPRKKKLTDFYTPPLGKKMHLPSNINMRDLICNIAQKYVLFRDKLF